MLTHALSADALEQTRCMTGPAALSRWSMTMMRCATSLQFLLEIAGFSVATYGSAAQFLREAPMAIWPASWWTSTCRT